MQTDKLALSLVFLTIVKLVLSQETLAASFYDSRTGNLPSNTIINVKVLLDSYWVKSQGDFTLESIDQLVRASFDSAKSWYVLVNKTSIAELGDNVTSLNLGKTLVSMI